MRKYWIIENGKPIGPFTASELKVRRDFAPTLPVWYSGLPDWTTVGELTELAVLLPIPEAEDVSQEPEQEVQPPVEPEVQPQPQSQPQHNFGFNSQWIRPQAAQQPEVKVYVERSKQPPTYVGWNILMMLCCCLPLGLIGLVYGNTVTRKWMSGDVEGAQKASEIAAWCLILSFVLSLVCWPFQMIYSLI